MRLSDRALCLLCLVLAVAAAPRKKRDVGVVPHEADTDQGTSTEHYHNFIERVVTFFTWTSPDFEASSPAPAPALPASSPPVTQTPEVTGTKEVGTETAGTEALGTQVVGTSPETPGDLSRPASVLGRPQPKEPIAAQPVVPQAQVPLYPPTQMRMAPN
jgi:hypothetical protein